MKGETVGRNLPAILILVVILPLAYAVVTWGVLLDWHVFTSGQNFGIGVAVGGVAFVLGVRNAVDLYYPIEGTPRDPVEFLAAMAFFYLLIPAVAVGAGFAVSRILEIPPWPALLLLVIAFWFRLFESPVTAMPRVGRPLLSAWHAKWKGLRSLKKGQTPVWWGNVPLQSEDVHTHFLIAGVTRSGKTTLLRLLMQQVLPEIGGTVALTDGEGRTRELPRDCRALVFDAKDDLYPELMGMGLRKPPVILNPFDARSVPWSMADDFEDPDDADEVAGILMPEEKESQPYFSRAGRFLLSGLFQVFMKTAPRRWTLRDIILAFENSEQLVRIYDLVPRIREQLTEYIDAREFRSTVVTVKAKVDRYRSIAAAWASSKSPGISIDRWMEEESILLLGAKEKNRIAIETINQLIVHRVQQVILDDSEIDSSSPTRRTWVILDEFPSLGNLDARTFQRLITKGRTYKASVVLAFQDIRDVRSVYGQSGDVMAAMCQNKIILRLGDEETAEWASGFFGTLTYAGQNGSRIVDPTAFLYLPLTSEDEGLSGFGRAASMADPFHVRFSGDELFGPNGAVKPASKDPHDRKFIKRANPEDFVLQPWNEEDRKRLGLSIKPNAEDAALWDLPRAADL